MVRACRSVLAFTLRSLLLLPLLAGGACHEQRAANPPAVDRPPDGGEPTADGPAPVGDAAAPEDADVVDAAEAASTRAADAAPDVTPVAPFVPHPDPKSVALFDDQQILDFHVSFPPGAWERLLSSREEPALRWVPCSFRFQEQTFADAACRRKGNMFDWDRTNAKPQFLVRFNHLDSKARFRGMRRLDFESFSGFAAPVRDRLGMWLMRQAGLDASRVNHVRVWRDGQQLGLYQNIEMVDQELLDDHFGPEAGGNLWESGVELETNETTANQARMRALEALLDKEPLTPPGDHAVFYGKLATLMDVPQVLREMAAETVLLTADNFSNNLANFYYYEHPRRGIMVLPWDFDSILAGPPDSDPFEYWSNGMPGKLRLLINQNPAWKAAFVNHVVQIRDTVLARMPAVLDQICAQIADAVRDDPNTLFTFEEFQADCRDLRTAIAERDAALRRMLGR
jgi:hypothetical protein